MNSAPDKIIVARWQKYFGPGLNVTNSGFISNGVVFWKITSIGFFLNVYSLESQRKHRDAVLDGRRVRSREKGAVGLSLMKAVDAESTWTRLNGALVQPVSFL